MCDLLSQISSFSDGKKSNVISAIRKYFTKLSKKSHEEQSSEFQPIFDFLNTENPNDSDEKFLNRLFVILGTIFSFPKPDIIGQLPLRSNDPYMLGCLVLLHNMKCDISMYYQECTNYVIKTFKEIANSQSKDFYYKSMSYYTRYLATSMKQMKNQTMQQQVISSFCESMKNLSPDSVNLNDLLFISQMMFVIWPMIQQCKSQQLVDTFMATIEDIFKACKKHPSAMLLTMFYLWFFFVKQIQEKMRNSETSLRHNFTTQIDLIASAAERTVSQKHHDLHSQFQWYLLFLFYWFIQEPSAKTKLLIFIVQGMKSVKQIENYKRVCTTVDNFNNSVKEQYTKGNAWPMFFFIGNIHSQLIHHFQIIQSIQGISFNPNLPQEKEGSIRNTKFGFRYQKYNAFSDSIVDKMLYTQISEKQTSSLDTALDWFYKEIDRVQDAKEKIMSILPFHTKFTRFIARECLLPDKKSKSDLYYFVKASNIWTEYAIVCSHRFCELKKFEHLHILFNKKDFTDQSTTTRLGQLIENFKVIHNAFTETILLTPEKFIDDVANEISDVILKYIEEDMITVDFFEVFTPIRENQTFLVAILNCLYSYVAENIKIMLSDDIHEANIIPKILGFVIRFCRLPNSDKDGEYYPSLLKVVKTYQRLIVTSIFQNVKRVSNQTDTFNAIYTDALIFSKLTEKKTGKKPSDLLFVHIKPLVFNDFIESNKFNSLPAFIEMVSLDCNSLSFIHCIEIFKVAFESNDTEIISKAAIIFSNIFLHEIEGKTMSVSEDVLGPVYQSLFANLHIMSKQAVLAVQKIIPYIPQHYTQQSTQEFPHCNIAFGPTGVDMLEIIHSIIRNYQDTEQNAIATFQLVSHCLEIVKENITKEDNADVLISELLSLLMKCYVYKRFAPTLEEYYKHLVFEWGEIMADGISNTFFLECISLAASSRSHISYTLYQIAKGILNHINSREHSDVMLKRTLEDIMSKKGANRAHVLIIGLSLFNEYFPDIITKENIKEFFIESTGIPHVDYDLPDATNRFLKRYLKPLNEQQKREFVDITYDILKTRSTPIRQVLIKRIRKIGIPFPQKQISPESFSPERLIDYQILPAQIAMGAQITPDIAAKLAEMIMARLDSVSISERLSRKNSLITELMHSSDLFNILATCQQLTSQTLNFLCNTLTSRFTVYRNAATKKFRLITSNKSKSNICCATIEEYCNNPDRIFTFFGHQPDRICFYRRLVKLNADKIRPRIVELFIKAFFDYTNLQEDEKLKNMCNLVQIVKTLTIKEYILREPVRKIITEGISTNSSLTFLENFILTSIDILSSRSTPNRALLLKHICKFLSVFPDKLVAFMFSSKCTDPINGFSILTDFILLNETNELFLTTISYVLKNKGYSQLHPAAVQLFGILADYDRFVITQDLAILTKSMFGDLLAEFSNHEFKSENIYTNLELVADIYIKIIAFNPTFENVTDFAKIFANPMFYHSETYSRFIKVAFINIPEDFSSSFLDYIINNNVPLSDVQFYVLISHAIIHCGQCDNDLIQKVWDTLFTRLAVENSYCSSLKCAVSLLKRWRPSPNNAKEITKYFIRGIKSGDCQTELYAIKGCLCLMKYENMFLDTVFYKIASVLLSYQKFFDYPYKELTYKFLNSRPDLYDDPPEEFIRSIAYFVHDKCAGSKDVLIMLNMFQHVPILAKFVPFSISNSYTLFIRNKMEMLLSGEAEYIEFDGLLDKGLGFIIATNAEECDVQFFIETATIFIKKILGTEHHSEFCQHFFSFIKTKYEKFYPAGITSAIKNFTVNSFACVSCACSIKSEELKISNEHILSSLIFMRKYFSLNLDDAWCILSYVIDANVPELSKALKETFDWFLPNHNESNRDLCLLVCKSYILSSPIEMRPDILTQIWEVLVSDGTKRAPFPCICTKLYTMFCVGAMEFLSFASQPKFAEFIFKSIENNEHLKSYLLSAAFYAIRSQGVSDEAKNVFLQNLPYHVNDESKCCITELVEQCTSYESSVKGADKLDSTIFLLIAFAHISQPKTRVLLIKQILSLLPENSYKRLEHLMFVVSPGIWNDLYLPLVCLLASPQTQEVVQLYPFSQSFQKIGSSMLYNLLLKYIEVTPHESQYFIPQFIDRIMQQKSKRMHNNAISGITAAIIKKKLSISPVKLIKIAHCCGLTNAVTTIDHTTEIPIHTLETILPFDEYYAVSASELTDVQRAASALTLLSKFDVAQKIYQLHTPSSSPFFSLMSSHNNHMFITEEVKEKKELGYACLQRSGFQSDQIYRYVAINTIREMKAQAPQELKKRLSDIKDTVDVQMRSSPDRTPEARDRITVALISEKISEMINSKKEFKFDSPEIHASINPSYYQTIEIGMNQGPLPKKVVVDEEPLFLSNPANACFKSIAGYHPTGLVVVSQTSIQETLQKMAESSQKSTDDWLKFAPFCYNVFAQSQKQNYSRVEEMNSSESKNVDDLFTTAFSIYALLLKNNDSISLARKYEVVSRIIVLLREISNASRLEIFEHLINKNQIFNVQYNSAWHLVLPQLMTLCKDPSICHYCEDLIKENKVEILGMSEELGTHNAQKVILESSDGITLNETINGIKSFFDEIFQIDFITYTQQKNLVKLLHHLKFAKDEELSRIKLDATVPGSQLEAMMQEANIHPSSFEELGRIVEAARKESNLSKLAKSISGAPQSYEEIANTLVLCAEKFNVLHHKIPLAETQFFMARNQANWLAENAVQFTVLKGKGTTSTLLLQKIQSRNSVDYERNMFMSYISPLFNYLAGADFFLHQRGIPFTPTPCKMKFIGSYAFSKCPPHINSLRRAYELFFHQTPSNSHKSKTSDDVLLRQIVSASTPVKFMRMKASFAASLGIAAARNIICQTRYPRLEDFFIDPMSGKVVPSFIVSQEGSESSFRSSPNVRRILGPNEEYRNEMVLSISAAMSAFLVSGYDTLSSIEELVSTSSFDSIGSSPIARAVGSRTEMFDSLLPLVPPNSQPAGPQEAVEWITAIENLIDSSIDQTQQPQKSIPWF